MATIDPSIPLNTSSGTVPVMMPAQVAQQGLTLADMLNRNQLQQQQVRDTQTLARLYQQHTNPDGTIDAPGIVRGLGEAGSGHLIPAFQTQQQALESSAATTAKNKADAASTTQGTLFKSLEASSAGIGSLLANPNVGHDDVVHQLATQVKQGTLTLEHAQNTIADMPPPTGNAAQDTANLRNWLQQQNLKIADAKTRLEATTAKPGDMNNGKTTFVVDRNPITNPGIIGTRMGMTTTPGEDLSAQTTRRGQDLQFTTDNNVIESTPGGFAVVNKGARIPAGGSLPVTNPNGFQTLPKDSPVYKAEQQFAQMQSVARDAADLLNGNTTASGAGALVDKANQFMGIGTESQANAAKLKALGGWLTANVPRMEGPQSDADRKAYEGQAGQVGDETLPTSVRLAALSTVMNLQQKYASVNGGNGASPVGVQPVTVVPPKPQPGQGTNNNRPPLTAFGL